MKTRKIALLFTLFTVFMFEGCKKFEESPKFTLRTVKNRLLDKDWEVYSTSYNDTVTEELYVLNYLSKLRFDKNGDWFSHGNYAGTYEMFKSKEGVICSPIDQGVLDFYNGFALQLYFFQLEKNKLGTTFSFLKNSKTYYYAK